MLTPWKKIKEEPYNAGWRKLLRKTFKLSDGSIEEFDVINTGNGVCILALTPDKQVILAKQFRPAAEKFLTEIPGGNIDEGEQATEAAARELLEETGYVGELQFVCCSHHSAYDTSLRYNFVALNCVKQAEPKNTAVEETEVVCMDLEEFKKHLFSGELSDPVTGFAGLSFLKLI